MSGSLFDLPAIAAQFEFRGDFAGVVPYGSGHINDTFCITFSQAGALVRYLLQRVNHRVFKDPIALMDNVERVTRHLAAKFAPVPDASRRALTLVRSREGRPWHRDASGNVWRAYYFVEKARAFDSVQSPLQAFEAARAFGAFQKALADLPAPRLHETIPDFHHTPKRFARFEEVVAADAASRVKLAGPEIEFALGRKSETGTLLAASLPERVTHNDTKINNVMLDDASGQGICVIDLDTVMPGLALYDFGDMVRTATSPAAEDERDLAKVGMRFPMFDALARGYLASAGEFLTSMEKELLVFAGKLITFEIGLRFLTDYLEGDIYFKVHRDGHNLDRARTQFKLVESIAEQENAMRALIQSI